MRLAHIIPTLAIVIASVSTVDCSVLQYLHIAAIAPEGAHQASSRFQSDSNSDIIQHAHPWRDGLHPRAIYNLPISDHWELAVDSFQVMLPDAQVAGLLHAFFTFMEAHAATFQNQFTVAQPVTYQLGELRLTFYSALPYIPWPLIRSVAALLRGFTERGHTGLFEGRAMHLSGIAVLISFHLILDAGAAN